MMPYYVMLIYEKVLFCIGASSKISLFAIWNSAYVLDFRERERVRKSGGGPVILSNAWSAVYTSTFSLMTSI
jgi:hypothetical protein